ncbi:EamA family transporter [Paenibacillus sp. FSL H7-0326]|uniref:DMT family transporter n=1 Tax=Paenibacillus sp. FSL H7-0326 TaxID=1921144 RepID=UPI00096CAF93|nr:DMT family transporter [Paenibacillus sp. FSL H7-0326]OMC64354.1 EamA family transporter [Paenibacillus sp. FSL H7-0326]
MIQQQARSTGHMLAMFTIFIWGTTFVSTKLLLSDFNPIEVLFLRFLIGYFILLLLYPRSVKTSSIKEELLFAGAGLSGVTLYFLLENIALTLTLAASVGIIVSIAPFFTALFAHFFLEGEKLSVSFIVGFIIALIGILLIGFNGSFVLKLNPLGDFLAILAPIFWAIYSVLMKKISERNYHTIGSTRKVFFYGLIFMLPTLLLFDIDLSFSKLTEPMSLLHLLYLGIGASALCFVTWNRAVGILGAVKTSIYIYFVPVITVIASHLVLSEPLSWAIVIGAVLTLVGSFISERRTKPQYSNH